MIQHFRANGLTTVDALEPSLWRVVTHHEDNLVSWEVVLDIKGPALDIRAAHLQVKRDVLGLVPNLSAVMENLIGVRVGPGMTKIVRTVVGGPEGSDRAAELVLDAMEMLVNALTVPELRKAAEAGGVPCSYEKDGPMVVLNDRVIGGEVMRQLGEHPRLKDSCAAFKSG